VVGGAKVSTKLDLLGNLIEKVDMLVIGGGMANTFLAAKGVDVGKSLCEHDLADTAKRHPRPRPPGRAARSSCPPTWCGRAIRRERRQRPRPSPSTAVPADTMILDAGPQSVARVKTPSTGRRR
jgi:phosphoglycerate kinase